MASIPWHTHTLPTATKAEAEAGLRDDVALSPASLKDAILPIAPLPAPAPPTWDDVTGKPATFPPTVPIAWSDITGDPATFPPTLPIPQSGITNLTTDLAGKAPTVHSHTYASLTGIPATFAPAPHGHTINEIATLDVALLAKAPLASPVFTGNPQAPTPTPGDNDTSIATTGFVTAAVTASSTAGVTNGDKGDIVVSDVGLTWMFDSSVVTAAARTVLDDASTGAMLTTLGAAPVAHTHAYSTLTGIPSAFTPAAHNHAQAEVNNLVTDLAAKEPLLPGGGTVSTYLRGDKVWAGVPAGPTGPTGATGPQGATGQTGAPGPGGPAVAHVGPTAPDVPVTGRMWMDTSVSTLGLMTYVNPWWADSHGKSAADYLLGSETNGLAIDFTRRSAVVRETAAVFEWEDKFDYADETALIAAGWTVYEAGGATGVVAPGDGTVSVTYVASNPSYISKQITNGPGIYQCYVDIVSKTSSVAAQVAFRLGTIAASTNITAVNIGAFTPNPGTYQLLTTFAVPYSNVWVSLVGATANDMGMTFGGIKLVRVSNAINTTPSNLLTYTGANPKLVWGNDGVLRYAPHNILLQSQTFDNASWVKTAATVTADTQVAPDGTLTAETLTSTATSASGTNQVVTTVAGQHTYSVYLKAGTATWVAILGSSGGSTTNLWTWFNLATGAVGTKESLVASATIQSVGNSWYRCSVTYTTVGGESVYIRLASADTLATAGTIGLTLHVWGAQLQRLPCHDGGYVPTTTAAAYRLPLDHDPLTKAPLGVLIEEARTNLLLQSQTFDNASWTKTSATTVTANTAIAPDGTLTADLASDINTIGFGGVIQSDTVKSAGATVTASLYVKKDNIPSSTRFPSLRVACTGGTTVKTAEVRLDTSTGAVFSQSVANGTASTCGSQSCGDYWRVWMTLTDDGANTIVATTLYPSLGAGALDAVQSATAMGSITIWGAQLEAGAFPTSYIPTTTAQVTRANDAVTLPIAQFPYSTTAGSLVAEFIDIASTPVTAKAVALGPTSAGSYIGVGKPGQTGWYAGGLAAMTGYLAGANNKIAVAFIAGNFDGSTNGAAVVTSASSDYAFTSTALHFGQRATAQQHLNSHLKSLKYLPRRATNAELVTMSTL